MPAYAHQEMNGEDKYQSWSYALLALYCHQYGSLPILHKIAFIMLFWHREYVSFMENIKHAQTLLLIQLAVIGR